MKKAKGSPKFAHTPKTKKGMGDFYGTGVKNPVGRVRTGTIGYIPVTEKQLKKPPKGLA